MSVVAYVPDLMDRSRLGTLGATFARQPAELVELSKAGDTVVVDLGRPGVLEVVPGLAGRRIIGFSSHVNRDEMAAAQAQGVEVYARSVFFSRVVAKLATAGD